MPLNTLSKIEVNAHFLDWCFQPHDGQLISKKESLRLPPRLSQLLSIFLANGNQVLTREELINSLWGNKTVNDDALSRSVAELRRILGDDRAQPIYVETLPKKGYRFIAPVSADVSSLAKEYPLRMSKPVGYWSIGGLFLVLFISILYAVVPDKKQSRNTTSPEIIKSALISAQRFTTDKALEQQPNISPLGTYLAFSVNKSGQSVVNLLDANGKLSFQLRQPSGHLYSPIFSPDEKQLVAAQWERKECSLWMYQLPQLNRSKLSDCVMPSLSPIVDWSSSGKQIALVMASSENKAAAIWLLNREDDQLTQLTYPSDLNAFDTLPKFSPDGTKLAFTRGTHSTRQLFYIELGEPKSLKPLTDGDGYIAGMHWLKNSEEIIYDSNARGDRNLWSVKLTSPTPQLIGARDARFPTLDKANSKLAYQEVRYNANIWEVDLSGESRVAKPLIEGIKYNNFPAYSPDGQQIAFVSNREGKSSIWLFDKRTRLQKKLLAIEGLDLISPVWANNGRTLLISSRSHTGYQCYQLNLLTEQYELLSAFDQSHYACQMAENGDVIAISKPKNERSQIIRFSSRNGVSQLTEFGVGRAQLTGNDQIIYSKDNEKGLYLMELNGKNSRVLLADFDNLFDNHWVAVDNTLYYVRYFEDENRIDGLWQMDLETLKKEKVVDDYPTAIGLTLSVDPSHNKILLVKTDSRQADIYLTHLNQE